MFRTLMVILLTSVVSYAHLGDTLEQTETRYGVPNKPLPAGLQTPLVDGARECAFDFPGWRIRCALLKATDGKEYVVRLQYTKIINAAEARAGGSATITTEERDAILKAESFTGTWRNSTIAEAGDSVVATLGKQLLQSSSLYGNIWLRSDGARGNLSVGGYSFLLELPQAVKYEEELKSIREGTGLASIPKY